MDAESRSHRLYFCLSLLVIELLLVIWSIYDHSLPVWDQAAHLVSGIECARLFRHPHLFSLAWYQSLFTVSYLYPPLVYFVYGIAKVILGTGRWVDVVVHMIFMAGLFASSYALALLILENYAMALLSAILSCTYHHAFWFAHTDLLDLPAFTAVVFGLLCFSWWQKYPSNKKAILFGLSFGLACLTKHTCLAFLAPPAILCFAQIIINKQFDRLRQMLLALLISGLTILPWAMFAFTTVCQSVGSIQKQGYDAEMLANLLNYLSRSTEMSLGWLMVIFLLSFISSPLKIHRRMMYIDISAVGALLIMSYFRWIPSPRYTLPLLIVMAMYTAYRAVSIWQSKLKMAKPLLGTLAFVYIAQFVLSDFYPYPIRENPLLNKCAEILGVPRIIGQYLGAHDPSIYPLPSSDWGDGWVLSVLKNNLGNRRQTLVIMPNSETVSPSTYIYLVKKENLNLDVVAVRTWTMLGDAINFKPGDASKIDWYLLKSGGQGFKLCDQANVDQYNAWCDYVRHSGEYALYGTKSVPDGSFIELYRKKNLP